MRYLLQFVVCVVTPSMTGLAQLLAADDASRPNIVWIVGEDASPHLRCYGETTIETPNLDRLAGQGVRFTRAFVTCPVCSPSRSAMVTGLYQTTLGAHNHRSQNTGRKSGGNTAYYNSYRLPDTVPLLPRLLKNAGYYTTLGAGPSSEKFGKTDYNFVYDRSVYDGADWRKCPPDKPFFAQIMLRGGKNRGAREHGTDPADVRLTPYYPDDPVLRRDWADYLNSWVQMDQEVGRILRDLEQAGAVENAVVFFWTDHGVSHMRGKQFLYDEGIRVPLIVRCPDRRRAGTTRDDLVVHVDVAATTAALAGLDVPQAMQGRDLFASNAEPREMIFCARDRCDETVDVIRCVRTGRFKYIRNFLSHMPHAQPNRYKDHKAIIRTMRELHAAGKLTPLQARVFEPTRPPEELYDLHQDPHETMNLVGRSEHAATLKRLRAALYGWMAETGDPGLIPEPILEELGRRHGSKYFVLQQPGNEQLVPRLIEVIEAGERGDRSTLRKALESSRPSLRYWAATWLGILREESAADSLADCVDDPSPAVRVAAAAALCQLGRFEPYADLLAEHIQHENLIVGMYAIRMLEQLGDEAARVRTAVEQAKSSRYEFTRRIARRLATALSE